MFGTALAETIAADPAFPALVSAVAAADPQRWTPLDLLTVAAEHLADADRRLTHPIRHDEYARLMTYSIDLFTTAAPYERDLNAEPVAAEPPMTPRRKKPFTICTPTPVLPPATTRRPPPLIDFDRDDDALLAALGVDLDQEPPQDDEVLPLDFDALYAPFEPGTGFEDQYPARCCPRSGCAAHSTMSTGCATAAPPRPPPWRR